jgi:5'-3' exonuclease
MDFLDAQGSQPGNNLLVVDGLNLAFRYKYANKKVFAQDYINTIGSLANSYKANRIVVLGDGGSSYREGIYPDYKGNRKELREKQTEQEAIDFEDFLNEFQRAFEQLGEMYTTFRFKGVEADDIAAYIVKHFPGKFDHIWLMSSDKDWDLLIDENVSRFSYVTRKEITLENWAEHYDYPLEEHISIKVLQGDKGDNIPGVSGVGIKRAISLVETYGSALDIYEILPIDSKYKYMQNLNEFGDTILLNYQLMDLITYCEEAIGKDNIEIVDREMKDG